MRWKGRRESSNVEDRRSSTATKLAIGGGGSILLVLLALFLGVDPKAVFNQGGAPAVNQPVNGRPQQPADPAEEELKKFVGVVLADTEAVWHRLFRRMGKTYQEPKLVLFRGQVRSACGFASAAVGPFYCPADQHVYLDLQFFQELKTRFRAPGDFAQAYVIAHEIGHHVQKLLGISDQVDAQRRRLSKTEFNKLSVRLELQADFLAGVWAHHAQKNLDILQPGDLEEAIRAANAIGDDKLQQQSRGYVIPDSFTHGTSAQRIRWFRRGLQTGDVSLRDELFRLDYDEL